MEFAEEQLSNVIGIMEKFNCQQHFLCFNSNFKNICECSVIGEDFVECMDERATICKTSSRFKENRYLCNCPVRRYLAIELGR